MDERDQGAAAERDRTDASLRAERDKTDHELRVRAASVAGDIEELVERARQRAQLVLDLARERVDEQLDAATANEQVRTRVADERRAEDAARASDQAAADARRHQERSLRQQALMQLLAAERAETDRMLGEERAHADLAVATRDDILGLVSHDLRTMLWTISLNAALLVSEAAADRDVVRRGDAIQRVTARMSRVVDDLIEVVRIEAGKLAVEPRVGDARRLAQDAVESFEPMAAARGVALATELRGDELQGRFDHERLLQVLGNLLNNAIRFSPDGGRVTLGVERTGPDLHLWVADAGPGIAADHLETIFDRFQQIERADHTGLGLGLYISRRIVAAHGGRIWAESQPGVGSTFHVVLPDAPPDGQSTVPRSA